MCVTGLTEDVRAFPIKCHFEMDILTQPLSIFFPQDVKFPLIAYTELVHKINY